MLTYFFEGVLGVSAKDRHNTNFKQIMNINIFRIVGCQFGAIFYAKLMKDKTENNLCFYQHIRHF